MAHVDNQKKKTKQTFADLIDSMIPSHSEHSFGTVSTRARRDYTTRGVLAPDSNWQRSFFSDPCISLPTMYRVEAHTESPLSWGRLALFLRSFEEEVLALSVRPTELSELPQFALWNFLRNFLSIIRAHPCRSNNAYNVVNADRKSVV